MKKSAANWVMIPNGVEQLANLIPGDSPNELPRIALMRDDVESMGEVKYDVLKNEIYATVCRTMDEVGVDKNMVLNIHDPVIYHVIGAGAYKFLSQLQQDGGEDLMKMVSPTTFKELIAINALKRCSDINAPEQEVMQYIRGKNGERADPLPFRQYLDETYGALIYEEQILTIGTKVAGLSWRDADTLRSAIKKKKYDVMDSIRPKFIDGMISRHGMSEAEATSAYSMIEAKKGSFVFSKSHAAAYAYVLISQCWLKHEFPLEYSQQLLGKTPTDKVRAELWSESVRIGHQFEKLNVLTSPQKTSSVCRDDAPFGKNITIGLEHVFSPEMSELIIKARGRQRTFTLVGFISQIMTETLQMPMPIIEITQRYGAAIDRVKRELSAGVQEGALDAFLPYETKGQRSAVRNDVCAGMDELVRGIVLPNYDILTIEPVRSRPKVGM
jgi:DNA polymerase-3 subunit alpha